MAINKSSRYFKSKLSFVITSISNVIDVYEKMMSVKSLDHLQNVNFILRLHYHNICTDSGNGNVCLTFQNNHSIPTKLMALYAKFTQGIITVESSAGPEAAVMLE